MDAKFDFTGSEQGQLEKRHAELEERRLALKLEMEALREEMDINRTECAMYQAERSLRAYKEEGLTRETCNRIQHLYGNYLYSRNPDDSGFQHDVYKGHALEVVRELGRIYEDIEDVSFDYPKTGVAMKRVLVCVTNMKYALASINRSAGNYPRALEWAWPVAQLTFIPDDDGTKEVTEDTVLLTEYGEITTVSNMVDRMKFYEDEDDDW